LHSGSPRSWRRWRKARGLASGTEEQWAATARGMPPSFSWLASQADRSRDQGRSATSCFSESRPGRECAGRRAGPCRSTRSARSPS
jgi:hypothetical protein